MSGKKNCLIGQKLGVATAGYFFYSAGVTSTGQLSKLQLAETAKKFRKFEKVHKDKQMGNNSWTGATRKLHTEH